jgi:putative ABC transport system permease protein
VIGLCPTLLRAGLRYQLLHRWQALLALSGIVMGVAVVLAVDLANSAANASFSLSSQHLRGTATHRVIGSAGALPDSIYRQLFTTAGHPTMTPVISTYVRARGHQGRLRLLGVDVLTGGDFRDQMDGLFEGNDSLGDWLSRPNAAALSASAAEMLDVGAGDTLDLSHKGRPVRLRIFAVSADSSLASRNLVVTDIATAQSIAGMQGKLSHIDVVLDEKSEFWLQQQLPPGVRLIDVREQERNDAGLSASFKLNLTAMSLLALMVGMFLIFNAISFSIVQRRNLLGRLRALGVLEKELATLVMMEALVLAIVGTLLGTLLGYWLGQGLTRIVAATVSELYYEVSADAMQMQWFSLAKAWSLGLAGTLVAAWLPARQAAATPPLTTLSRAALEISARKGLPRVAMLGALLFLLGFTVALTFPGGVVTGFVGLFILLPGAAMMTPFVLHLSHSLFSRLPFRGIWRIAIRDLERHISRLSTAAAALMVALAASVGVAVMVDSMHAAVSDWLQDILAADLYIAAEGYEDGATLPAEVIDGMPGLDPVSAFSSYRTRTLDSEGRRVILIAARLAPQSREGFQFVATVDADPWSGFTRGAILVSEPLANRFGLAAGDTLSLPTPAGTIDFDITAVFRDFASEHGRIFMSQKYFRKHWQDPEVNTMALFARQGDTKELLHAASERFSPDHQLVYTAAGEIYQASMTVFERTFRITEVLRMLSVLVAFVGVLSALMALQLERRKEYAILRAVGLTRQQLSQLILIESAALGTLAALLAIPTGLAMAWILTSTIQTRAFGWSMPFVVHHAPLVMTLVLGLTAALLAGVYPAWRSARRNPAAQLRED